MYSDPYVRHTSASNWYGGSGPTGEQPIDWHSSRNQYEEQVTAWQAGWHHMRGPATHRGQSSFPPAPAVRTSEGLYFIPGDFSEQHPRKGACGFVDADATDTGSCFLSIADGVTGVQAQGIDPSQLPHSLLRRCRDLINERNCNLALFDMETYRFASSLNDRTAERLQEGDGSWLRLLLARGFLESGQLGATTVLLCALEGDTMLLCNLGDCKAQLLRRPHPQHPYTIVFQTPVQRSTGYTVGGVEVPRQLHRASWELPSQALLEQICGADVFRVHIAPGDLLIMGTDGIGDNLSDIELLDVVNGAAGSVGGVVVNSPEREPFLAREVVQAALKANRKPDDTTCIVATISGSSSRIDSSAADLVIVGPGVPLNNFHQQHQLANGQSGFQGSPGQVHAQHWSSASCVGQSPNNHGSQRGYAGYMEVSNSYQPGIYPQRPPLQAWYPHHRGQYGGEISEDDSAYDRADHESCPSTQCILQ